MFLLIVPTAHQPLFAQDVKRGSLSAEDLVKLAQSKIVPIVLSLFLLVLLVNPPTL